MLVLVAVALGLAVRAVRTLGEPVPTALLDGRVLADGRLAVTVGSCNKSPTGEVSEDDAMVTITAFAPPPGPDRDDCADGLVFRLDEPLGDRLVVDGASGLTIGVSRPGKVQAGDLVSVLAEQPLDADAGDSATVHETNERLAEQWSALGATGPPPVFDPQRLTAIVITSSDSLSCSGTVELAYVDVSTLHLAPSPGEPGTCTPSGVAGLVTVTMERQVVDELTSVSIRDRSVPLGGHR